MSGINRAGKRIIQPITHLHHQHIRAEVSRGDKQSPHINQRSLRQGGSPADLVAARRGMDIGLQRARISAAPILNSASASGRTTRRDISYYNQPFPTDRPAGDPDRNRAVNPAIVTKTPKGRFLYPVHVKGDAHFFDKDHKSRGEIKGNKIRIDFGRQKTMVGPNGRPHRYVYARGVNEQGKPTAGYVRRSALTNFKDDIDKAFRFPIHAGTRMVDGMGVDRGEIGNQSVLKGVRINYGQKRDINGVQHYYAFDVGVKG